ncbi:glycoside hydrolase family 18 protein [Clostridium oryzae]|uniref:chitinase n=1 Tax=Clostridium oryzae TaxID=1450648 RepID=A0A1V4IXN6_9CLOT|nr:glycoside hydrolase family 18 protein [Clostridium oryzae]OPJ64590.1 chitinase A1 precursor [Clostridium oryzae]
MNKISNYEIMGYLSDAADWKEEDIDAGKLTCINYAFGLIENGKLKGEHLKKLNILNKIKKANTHLKTVLSIGGWGADGFSDAVLNEERREKFVASTMDFVIENDFDGIDIDWEYPCDDQAEIVARDCDKQNYTLYLKLLREKLDEQGKKDGKKYILSAALGAGQKYVDNIEIKQVQKYLDFINLMTYDMRGSFTNITGHHANTYPMEKHPDDRSAAGCIDILINAGVPKEKIIIGAAFYGRMWEGVKSSEGTGLSTEAEASGCVMRDFTTLYDEYIDKNGYKRYWDDIAKASYLFNGSNFVSYEDEISMIYKSEYVKQKGIGGIMFWEYPLDKTGKLLNSIYGVLGDY